MRSLIEKIKRIFFWGWNMRYSYDFDAATIYDMLLLKLKKMHHEFKYHGHCMWQEKGDEKYYLMIELEEAIELCQKLSENDSIMYDNDMWDAHDKKWGKLEVTSIPIEGTSSSQCIMSREFVFTKEDKEKEKEECRHIYHLQDEKRKRDLDRFHELLRKNIDYWWD